MLEWCPTIIEAWSWVWGGPAAFGFTLGYVGGRSDPGTSAKLIGTIVTLIGGLSIFLENPETTGMFMGGIAIGYFLGVTIGLFFRGLGIWFAEEVR